MTKKNEAVQKPDGSSQLVEVRAIDNRVTRSEESDLSRRENSPPPAYKLGKVAGTIVSLLMGFFHAQKSFNPRNTGKRPERGNRKRRRKKGDI